MRYLTFALWVLIVGCSLFESNNIDVEIQTDKSAYQIDSTETIHVDITNHSDDTIYYICTGQIYLEELSNSQVVNTWLVHGFEECLSPGPIESDETESFEIDLFWIWTHGFLGEMTLSEGVKFRLRVDLYEDIEFENMVTGSQVFSNQFTLEFI